MWYMQLSFPRQRPPSIAFWVLCGVGKVGAVNIWISSMIWLCEKGRDKKRAAAAINGRGGESLFIAENRAL